MSLHRFANLREPSQYVKMCVSYILFFYYVKGCYWGQPYMHSKLQVKRNQDLCTLGGYGHDAMSELKTKTHYGFMSSSVVLLGTGQWTGRQPVFFQGWRGKLQMKQSMMTSSNSLNSLYFIHTWPCEIFILLLALGSKIFLSFESLEWASLHFFLFPLRL
jgi:hypothetical protein